MWIIAGQRSRPGAPEPVEDGPRHPPKTALERSRQDLLSAPRSFPGPSLGRQSLGRAENPVELTRTYPQIRGYAPLPRHWPGEAGRTSWPVSRTKIVPSSAQQ